MPSVPVLRCIHHYRPGQPKLPGQFVMIEAVAADEGVVATEVQHQLETPLQRERTGVGDTQAVVGERGESGWHTGCPDAWERTGWGDGSECVVR